MGATPDISGIHFQVKWRYRANLGGKSQWHTSLGEILAGNYDAKFERRGLGEVHFTVK